MKRLELTEDEQRTLREMGVFHPHPRTRVRTQGILRLSQGLEGMERFVTGDYSVGQPVALMAGTLRKSTSDYVPAMRTYLSSAAAQAALGMVADPAGKFVRSPASFSDAEFDTEHKRPAGKAPAMAASSSPTYS